MIDTNAILGEVVLGLIVPGSILKICISLVFAIYSTPQLAKWHYFVSDLFCIIRDIAAFPETIQWIFK